MEDLRQETFVRVIAAVRREGGVRQPERFGAFINSICNNVLLRYYRSTDKNQPMEDVHMDIPDKVLGLEDMLDTKQSSQRVCEVLGEMSQRDQNLLRAIYFEEKDKDEVCREFGVSREQLRVLLHRTKNAFRVKYDSAAKQFPGSEHVSDADQIPSANQQEPYHTPIPPGATLHSIAGFICSKKTMEEIVIPLLADMQFEYCEALSSGRKWNAEWVRVRVCWSFFAALGINRLVGLCARIFLRFSSR